MARRVGHATWLTFSSQHPVAAGATAPGAEVALGSFDRVVLIAGGRDKGQDFRPLHALVRRIVAHLVLIGEGAARIAAAWPEVPATRAATLAAAVDVAFERARATARTVLFS